jgi:hypothetical protein
MGVAMSFSVGDQVITTKVYAQGNILVYEDKKGEVVKVTNSAQFGYRYRVRFTPHKGSCPCCRQGAQEVLVPETHLRAYSQEEGRQLGVDSLVSATTTIWTEGVQGDRYRLAHRGDQGVVMAVHKNGVYLVKFDPVLSTRATGEPELLSSYRTGRVRGEHLVRRVEDELIFSGMNRKGRARVFLDVISKREKSRATTEDDLLARILRLQRILSNGGRNNIDPFVLVEEGFVKERELAMLLEGMVKDHKIMKYPWSQIPQKYQRLLLTAGTPDQAVTRVMKEDRSVSSPVSKDEAEAQRRLLRATAIWGRSQRRLVRVSEASQETLFRVAVQRAALGLPVCHWNYLSAPGGTMVEYGAGIMFQWDGFKSEQANHAITFGAPRGVFLGEHLEFVRWRLAAADDKWWDEGFSHVWQVASTPYYMRRMDFEATVSAAIRELQVEAAAQGEPITRAQAAEAVLQRPHLKLVHMSINLIAALHNFHHGVVKVKQQDKVSRRRAKNSLRSIFQINLDDDGLSTWAETWCVDTAERESQTGSHGGTDETGDVSLHKRVGHISPVWVLRKNVRSIDKVLGTKGGRDGKTEYCKVERPRIGCWAGKGKLKANEARIRLGSDDLDARTPTLAILPDDISDSEEE